MDWVASEDRKAKEEECYSVERTLKEWKIAETAASCVGVEEVASCRMDVVGMKDDDLVEE